MTISARPTPKAAPPHPAGTPVSRREFLYYLLGGSGALLVAGTCAGVTWFSQKVVRYGLDSGVFLLDLSMLPQIGTIRERNEPGLAVESSPFYFQDGYSWLVHMPEGLIALDAQCTYAHQPARVKWVNIENHFMCPWCGSRFNLAGGYIWGSAPRDLDRFALEVTTPDGTPTTPLDGSPIPIVGATRVVLDTTRRIPGKARG
jgi:Rieske Fe-S protein